MKVTGGASSGSARVVVKIWNVLVILRVCFSVPGGRFVVSIVSR